LGYYRAEAFILRSRDYGEADKILTLYGRDQGKFTAIVKGVRRPTSRLRGAVQPLTLSDLQLYKGRTMDTVTQGQLLEAFHAVHQDLDHLAHATYLAELVEGMVPEREPNRRVFRLLGAIMHLLPVVGGAMACRYFDLQLMHILGYRPILHACAVCGGELARVGGKVPFSAAAGGVLCPGCAGADPGARMSGTATVQVMGFLLQADPKALPRLHLPPETLVELGTLMQNFITYRLEKRLRSRDFLNEIGSLPRDR